MRRTFRVSRIRLMLMVSLVGGLSLTLLVGSSSALPTGCTFDPGSGFTVCEFGFTGAEQAFTVPGGVTSVQVTAVGAAGGNAFYGGAAGGEGAFVNGDLAVTPGETLYVEVGGTPTNDASCSSMELCIGGFNGGGNGSTGDGTGGGGASDVRTITNTGAGTLGSRLLVAAGGGGGGDTAVIQGGCAGGMGGNAGTEGTQGMTCGPAPNPIGGGGGGAGTSNSGGSGGTSPVTLGEIGPGGNGSLGQGGGGGGPGAGGGGGGGLYGGGGGGPAAAWAPGTFGCPKPPGNTVTCYGGGGGGGGGSSLVPPGGTGPVLDPVPAQVDFLYTSVTDQLAYLQTSVTGVGPGTSFVAKATSIQGYLAANDTADACGALGAFINQVNAQTGKKITTVQAASFISQAKNIEATLGC